MGRKRYKPEEIAGLLRQADVLHSQGMTMSDAIRQIGVSEVTFYRWRKEYAGGSLPLEHKPRSSSLAHPGRTATLRASTHASGTSCSTARSSTA